MRDTALCKLLKNKNILCLSIIIIAFVLCHGSSIAEVDMIEEYDIEKQYDVDYSGGNASLYNKRFGSNRIIPREEDAITNSFNNVHKRISNNSMQIRMLDFGCGDGRMFPVIERLANQHPDRQIELIAYDISAVGLEESIRYLETSGYYTDKKPAKLRLDTQISYLVGFWKKDNLTVKIIHGNKNDDLEHIKFLIRQPVHVTFSIFTVLGHVAKRDNRQAAIRMLAGLMDKEGELIINVSTASSLPKEVMVYQILRDQYETAKKYKQYYVAKKLKTTLGIATEPGDIYYTKSDDTHSTHSYGHVYAGNELLEDLVQANLVADNVQVMSVEQPYVVTQNRIRKYCDTMFSRFLSINLQIYPFNVADKLSKNIYAVARRK